MITTGLVCFALSFSLVPHAHTCQIPLHLRDQREQWLRNHNEPIKERMRGWNTNEPVNIAMLGTAKHWRGHAFEKAQRRLNGLQRRCFSLQFIAMWSKRILGIESVFHSGLSFALVEPIYLSICIIICPSQFISFRSTQIRISHRLINACICVWYIF